MEYQGDFDFFYGKESERYRYITIPKLLLEDGRFQNISAEAKLLYGCLLDRNALSQRNGWIDEQNRAIYAPLLGCRVIKKVRFVKVCPTAFTKRTFLIKMKRGRGCRQINHAERENGWDRRFSEWSWKSRLAEQFCLCQGKEDIWRRKASVAGGVSEDASGHRSECRREQGLVRRAFGRIM